MHNPIFALLIVLVVAAAVIGAFAKKRKARDSYLSLDELQSVRGKLGLPIERDLHFEADKSISAYAEEARQLRRIVA